MQTARVLQFPFGVQNRINNLMGQFLRTSNYRTLDATWNEIKQLLIHNGLTKLHCLTFTVYLTRTGNLIFDTSHISTNECCPNCGKHFMYSKSLTILQGHKFDRFKQIDKYLYGCPCGTIYAVYREGVD